MCFVIIGVQKSLRGTMPKMIPTTKINVVTLALKPLFQLVLEIIGPLRISKILGFPQAV